jgi:hypothetical protein
MLSCDLLLVMVSIGRIDAAVDEVFVPVHWAP